MSDSDDALPAEATVIHGHRNIGINDIVRGLRIGDEIVWSGRKARYVVQEKDRRAGLRPGNTDEMWEYATWTVEGPRGGEYVVGVYDHGYDIKSYVYSTGSGWDREDKLQKMGFYDTSFFTSGRIQEPSHYEALDDSPAVIWYERPTIDETITGVVVGEEFGRYVVRRRYPFQGAVGFGDEEAVEPEEVIGWRGH